MLGPYVVRLAPLHQGRLNITHRRAAARLELDHDGKAFGHTGEAPTHFLSNNERQHLQATIMPGSVSAIVC